MGNAVKSIGKVYNTMYPAIGMMTKLGKKVGKSSDSGLTQKNFDITKEAKKYEEIYAQQRAEAQARNSAANSPALIQQLSQQAMGQGPSLAEAQLKSATNRNLAQQLAAAGSMRGRNPAAAQRQILTQQGDAGRQLAEQSAVARLAEQQQSMQQLTQQQALSDSALQNSTQQGFQTAIAPATNKQQYDLARAGIKAQNNVADKQLTGSMAGAAGTAIMAMMSDENEKTNIKSGSNNVSSFLDTLSAKEYNYKDTSKPGTAKGKRTGVMAQDLEKSQMGKALVHDTPNGKMVDIEQGFGAVLAAQAELNERLKAVEGKSKPQKMSEGGYVEKMKYQTQDMLSKLKGSNISVSTDMKKGKSSEPGASNELQSGERIEWSGNDRMPTNEMANPTMMAAQGGKVPGRAEVAGDSEQNDKVDVKLSPGEIIIPRSYAGSPEMASAFIKQLFAQQMANGGFVDSPELAPAPVAPAQPAAPAPAPAAAPAPVAAQAPSNTGNSPTSTDTKTQTGGSSPGGASTGGVGSGIGGAGTGGAATGGASTGGAGTVTLTLSGNSGTGSNSGGGSKKGKGKGGKEAPTIINISNVGGRTDAGNVASGDGPGALGTGGKGSGSGGGGGGAAPSEPDFSNEEDEQSQDEKVPGRKKYNNGGIVEPQSVFEEYTKRNALKMASEYRNKALNSSGSTSDMAKRTSEKYEREAIAAALEKKRLREGQ